MNLQATLPALALMSFLITAAPASAAVIATFDDLASLPAVDSAIGFEFANGGSSSYQGVLWEDRFRVVGDAYRVDPAATGPLYGIPHSGHYFITNEGVGSGNDGVFMTTSQVLTGAWFGRNEYYGFGNGADQVTIRALNGTTVLASVVFDLPAAAPGLPGPLGFVDTSVFLTLAGITGYRIDRHELGTLSGNWVADDFTFVPASQVDEPSVALILLGGALALVVARRRAVPARWRSRSQSIG